MFHGNPRRVIYLSFRLPMKSSNWDVVIYVLAVLMVIGVVGSIIDILNPPQSIQTSIVIGMVIGAIIFWRQRRRYFCPYQLRGYMITAIVLLSLAHSRLEPMIEYDRAYDRAVAKMSRVADQSFQNTTPEQFMSQRDNADLATVPTYANLVDRLDQKCLEDRNEVSVMVVALNGLNRKAGFEESFFATLSTYTEAAESGFEQDGSCIEVFEHLDPGV